MEHIILTPLSDGMLRLAPEAGYLLHSDITNRNYSEAITSSTDGFRAVLSGVSPEPHERTLDDAKAEKLAALKAFAAEDKYFLLGSAKMWLGPEKRANLKNAAEALKAQFAETVQYEGKTIPTDTALQMLSAVEAYAALHTMNEATHKAAIEAKRSINTVDNYNFTTGYPEHLTFTL